MYFTHLVLTLSNYLTKRTNSLTKSVRLHHYNLKPPTLPGESPVFLCQVKYIISTTAVATNSWAVFDFMFVLFVNLKF